MSKLIGFDTAKQKLLNIYSDTQYEEIFFSVQLPKKQALEQNKFAVAVCGQMKAGKSTFLNAWLFGDEVLPVDATPQTAKLTEIRYGEQCGFSAEFYTKDEWSAMKQDENSYQEYIRPFVEKLTEKHGIGYGAAFLGANRSEADLRQLTEYVGAEGRYQPWVKSVTLYLDNPMLKECTIVDTPGTNDPNKVRSKVTTDWIEKADAVIFLTYSGQVMSAKDAEFLNNYLSHIGDASKIIGCSVADACDDFERVKESAINSIKAACPGFAMAIQNNIVYPIASKYSIVNNWLKRHETGEQLPENTLRDMIFYVDSVHVNNHTRDWWIDNKGLLPEFVEAVESELIAKKGVGLIENAKREIENACSKKRAILEEAVSNKLFEIENVGKSISELECEVATSKRILETLQSKKDEVAATVSENDFDVQLRLVLEKVANDAYAEICCELDKIIKADAMIQHSPWLVKHFLESGFHSASLRDCVITSLEKMTKKCEAIISNIDGIEQAIRGNQKLGARFVVDAADVLEKLAPTLDLLCNRDVLEKLRRRKWYFVTDVGETRKQIKTFLNEKLFKDGSLIAIAIDQLRSAFDERARNDIQRSLADIERILEMNNKLYKEMRKKLQSGKVDMGRLEQELSALRADVINFDKRYTEKITAELAEVVI